MAVATIAIPWDDGSGDNLYMDFSRMEETNNTIYISSDENNTSVARTKVIKFQGDPKNNNQPVGVNQAAAVLKLVQQIDNYIVATFESTYSVYDDQKAAFKVR